MVDGGAMTAYVAAYDVESPQCLAVCRKIVRLHRRCAMPATFFVVGRLIEAEPATWRTSCRPCAAWSDRAIVPEAPSQGAAMTSGFL